MFKVIVIAISVLLFACDQFPLKNAEGPTPLKIKTVVRCNKYKTCVVFFENGAEGLMTSPKEGEYGCKSMSNRSFVRCDGP